MLHAPIEICTHLRHVSRIILSDFQANDPSDIRKIIFRLRNSAMLCIGTDLTKKYKYFWQAGPKEVFQLNDHDSCYGNFYPF